MLHVVEKSFLNKYVNTAVHIEADHFVFGVFLVLLNVAAVAVVLIVDDVILGRLEKSVIERSSQTS